MGSSLISSNCCGTRDGGNPAKNVRVVKRVWTKVHSDPLSKPATPGGGPSDTEDTTEVMKVKMMHWNILADKLAHDSFTKVPKEYLKWEYRLELIKQHISRVDPDVLGLSEVDVLPLYRELAEIMKKMGYSDYFVEKPSRISGSAIFYKKDKFACLQQNSVSFGDDSSQFFMYCRLALKTGTQGKSSAPSTGSHQHDPKFQFVFGETHLKAKPKFMEERIR